jgi:hypothetical protein
VEEAWKESVNLLLNIQSEEVRQKIFVAIKQLKDGATSLE